MDRKFVNCDVLAKVLGVIAIIALVPTLGSSQQISRLEREQAQVMLKAVASDVRQYYYDPKLHGIDWDAKVGEARERIAKAISIEDASADIAALLETLDDSHTYFMPPRYPIREDYGWRFQMVGNRCYVTQVRPRSDAEIKGLKPGDQVLTIDGFTPTRASLWRMEYALNVLAPRRGLRVELLDSYGTFSKLDVMANVRQTKQIIDLGDVTGRDIWSLGLEAEEIRHLARARYEELGPDVMILRIPLFFQTELEVEGLIDKARKHNALIIDLRGNSGGAETSLKYLLGGVFGSDVKIADRVARESTTPLMAKSNQRHIFSGKLIVLVDSGSASAAELFARTVQIEKRGTVLGDQTSGSTMEAKFYNHRTGLDPIFYFGALITEANLVMVDGKSLEHVGVTPDETILPTAADLANGRDPVMARAAEIAGVKLSPESAAKLFPYEWPNE